jgi:hypothetical protein
MLVSYPSVASSKLDHGTYVNYQTTKTALSAIAQVSLNVIGSAINNNGIPVVTE